MKAFLKAYTSFTRTERLGILALTCLLVLLIIIKATMQVWVKPKHDIVKEQQLAAAWEAFQAKEASPQPSEKELVIKDSAPVQAKLAAASTKAKQETPSSGLFYFDPNTVDSMGLIKLGLQEKTVAIFLHWRAKGKVFHKKQDMKRLYTLTEADYNRLEPYIRINNP